MIKRVLVLILVATLAAPVAHSATTSATPTPEATPTKKEASAPTNSKKAAVSKKASTKKKANDKKRASLSPSPSPKWPPAGFKSNGEIFAKIPNAKTLVGIVSSNKALTKQLAQRVDGTPICEKFSCGAIQLASLSGCRWWDVNAKLVGPTSAEDKTVRTFGLIRTLAKASAPKAVVTVLLISEEPIELGHIVAGIYANCHNETPTEKIPSTTYTALGS